MSIRLKYAGESEAEAKPWIIVQCDERASKRVRRFFNQQQIKAQYQPRDAQSPDVNFGLSVHGIPPKQMATESEHYIRGDISDGAPTLCGKPIKICTSNGTRLATLGGLIKVVNSEGIQLYGMTAGHIITRKEFDRDGVDHDDDDTNGKQSMEDRFSTVKSAAMADATEDIATDEASMTDDQSCSGDKDADDHDESSEQGEDEEEYELDFGSVDDQQEKSNIKPAALSQCLQRSNLLQVRWPELGHLSFVSHQPASDNDLDWALIKFHDPTLCRPNLLTFPEHTYEFGVSARLREGPRRLTRATRSRDVLLLSGMAGLKRGKLATSFGYLMIGPVKQFKEIYSVSMSDGSVLDAGDCGSWVVDSVTHEVYGHVVASDAFGDAYVIPLDNTFRDIRQQLATDQVSLPTESEVLEWIKPSGNIQAPKNHSFLGSFAPIIPECYGDLRLDYERLKATYGGPFESYKFMSGCRAPLSNTLDEHWGTPFESDDYMAPLSNNLDEYWGTTSAIHSKSTAILDIASVADPSLPGSCLDSGYSSTSSSPLSYAEETGAVSSTASGEATDSQKYSSTLFSSSSSAASATPDYLCLHRFCNFSSKRETDLERHMTKHFPPPSNEEVDCATIGCVRRGDHGFRRKDKLYAIASMKLEKRRASPSDEDKPRKRTEYFRAGHNQPETVWPNIAQSLLPEQQMKRGDSEVDSAYGSMPGSRNSSPFNKPTWFF